MKKVHPSECECNTTCVAASLPATTTAGLNRSCLQPSTLTTWCLSFVFRTRLLNSFSCLNSLPPTSPLLSTWLCPPARPLAGFVEFNDLKSQTQQASPLLCAAPAQQRVVELIHNLCTFPQYLNALLFFFFFNFPPTKKHIYEIIGADTICWKTCSGAYLKSKITCRCVALPLQSGGCPVQVPFVVQCRVVNPDVLKPSQHV